MSDVYNLRIGDMLYNNKSYDEQGEVVNNANIVAIIYKMTPKYAYYAICARNEGNPTGDHFVTKDNRAKKSTIYNSIRVGNVGISYSNGTRRRRKIEDFS